MISTCKQCGKSFQHRPTPRIYCSRRCFDIAAHARSQARFDVPPKTCAHCGKPFNRKPTFSDSTWAAQRYCSQSCVGAGRSTATVGPARRRFNELHPEANAARLAKSAAARRINYPGSDPIRSGRAKAAQLMALSRCADCERPYSGLRSLHRHHIDHDPTNNALANLVVLCPKCHKARHIRDEAASA